MERTDGDQERSTVSALNQARVEAGGRWGVFESNFQKEELASQTANVVLQGRLLFGKPAPIDRILAINVPAVAPCLKYEITKGWVLNWHNISVNGGITI